MDYFYEQEAELFTFYRIPKELFTNPKYKHTSAEAKVLYGLLLDRNSISRKNGWVDTQRRVFIQYSREEAMEKLGCGHNTIVKLFKELNEIGLIEEVRQGLGKTNIIYVKKFAQMNQGGVAPEKVEQRNSSRSQEIGDQDFRKTELQNSEKRMSGCTGESKENPRLEAPQCAPSYTDTSYTDMSYININNTDLSNTELKKDIYVICKHSQSVSLSSQSTGEYIKALRQTAVSQSQPDTTPQQEKSQPVSPKASAQPQPQHQAIAPLNETALKELEHIFQNAQTCLFDARLFIEHVIKKLYTDGHMPYILKMGLTHTDIQDRLKLLSHVHIDAALKKMVNCLSNKELYFAKCLLTAIVEVHVDDLVFEMRQDDSSSATPNAPECKPYNSGKIPQRDNFDQREPYTDEEIERIYAVFDEEVMKDAPLPAPQPVLPKKSREEEEWEKFLNHQEQEIRLAEYYVWAFPHSADVHKAWIEEVKKTTEICTKAREAAKATIVTAEAV